MKKIVLTWAPNSWKSTLINELKKDWIKTINESARIIIENEKEKKSDILPWKNIVKFQKAVLKLQISEENKEFWSLKKWEKIILDRWIFDWYWYFLFNWKNPIEDYEILSKERKYDKIFLLEPVPKFEDNWIRFESTEDIKKIHILLKKSYEKFWYNVEIIPFDTVENRKKFLLERIEKIN